VDNWMAGWLGRTVTPIVTILISLFAALSAFAEPHYPAHSIRVIVPFAAGGPTDIVTRVVTAHMAITLGQQILIENVVGGGGTTAAIRTMRAQPDGYTLMMGHMGTHGAAVAMYPRLAYGPTKDFAPIGMVAGMPVVVLARNGLSVSDLHGLLGLLRSRPGRITMAHAGVGSIAFATCALLATLGDVEPATKAFQGTAPALDALAAGEADFLCDQIVSAAPRIQSGAVRGIAIAEPTRSPILPELPTTAEAGLPAFEVRGWNALFAPRATPAEIVADLNRALGRALDDPEIRKELNKTGARIAEPAERSPAALATLVDREVARWKPLAGSAILSGH
jgi:tripartite-type tricarboxylate transporter receptor subunit TctC